MLDLQVGSVGSGGVCVARYPAQSSAGQVVFVRGALPGEQVRAQVVDATSRFLRAEVMEVLAASPERVTPPCPLARVELPRDQRCGGCDWQHTTAECQRELKRAVVAAQLQRIAGLEWSGVVEAAGDPVGPTAAGLGWRTRMQFAVHPDSGQLGLRAARSHRVLELAEVGGCRIAHPAMAELVAQARFPGCQAVEVTVDADGRLGLLLTAANPEQACRAANLDSQQVACVEAVPSRNPARPAKGPRSAKRPRVTMAALGRRWQVSIGGFWQVHLTAADTLAAAVLQGLQGLALTGATACDLYSGAGLFTHLLAQLVGPSGHVVAVESSALAVQDARVNLASSPQVTLVAARVEAAALPERAQVVVLDPPRAGAGREVVHAIAGMAPQRVIYVSCDPATLARDLATFATLGYPLRCLRAFDLFPLTSHTECVAVLGSQ